MVERLSIEKLREIDAAAEKFHDDIFGNSTEYIKLDDFLKQQGIEINYIVDIGGIDGYLQWNYDTNAPTIVINITNAPVRQRFTMAHELGHLVLDWGWNLKKEVSYKPDYLDTVLSYRGKIYDEKEQKADEFAAAFLIPKTKLGNLINEFKVKYRKEIENQEYDYDWLVNQLIDQVSYTYNVAKATARLRLKNYLRQVTSE